VTVSADDGTRYSVLDVHQHISIEVGEFDRDRPARLAFMDRFGIDQACLSPPNLAPRTISSHELNRRVSAYAKTAPERFPFALGTIDVRGGDAELEELGSFPSLGLCGVVWHHMFQGAFLDHPLMTSALEYCEATRLPAFIHVITGSLLESPWRLGRLCERFPKVSFVAMDALSSPHQADWTIEMARHLPNLFADTAVLASFGNAVEKFAEAVGPERLLLGTDFETNPKAFSFPYALYEILHSSLPADAKQEVLGASARRLLST
jgi:predicted TIM-barrel fold metal-dependent hydrolase